MPISATEFQIALKPLPERIRAFLGDSNNADKAFSLHEVVQGVERFENPDQVIILLMSIAGQQLRMQYVAALQELTGRDLVKVARLRGEDFYAIA